MKQKLIYTITIISLVFLLLIAAVIAEQIRSPVRTNTTAKGDQIRPANQQVCIAGTKKCYGNFTQTCIKNAWVNNTNCKYGCAKGICNPPPKDDCTAIISHSCFGNLGSSSTPIYKCTSGQGTDTNCNLGKCYWASTNNKYCESKGCNLTTGLCN